MLYLTSLIFTTTFQVDRHDIFVGLSSPRDFRSLKYKISARQLCDSKDEAVLDTSYGRYLDVYERREDDWRIIERVCVHEGTTAERVEEMGMNSPKFRQGSFDRPSSGRRVGP